MKKFSVVCLLLASFAASALAYMPPKGIPDPGGTWGAFHPIDAAKPIREAIAPGWFEATPRVNTLEAGDAHDCYYIDKSNPSATDTANPYGSPTKPRLTIPNIVYAAGSYVEIHGGSAGTNIYSSPFSPRGVGTDLAPIWFVGIDSPVLASKADIGALNVPRISYLVFDGINWLHGGKPAIRPRFTNNSIDHIAFRNCLIKGDHTTDGGGVGIGASSPSDPTRTTEDIVIYNCEIADFGDPNNPNEECAVYPSSYVTRLWILESNIHNVAEDGFGGSHGGRHTSSGYYIGRCRIHHNLTNGIDIKGMKNVIVSECVINDHYDVWVNGVHKSSGIGQAVTFHYGGSSSGPGNILNFPEEVNFLFNTVYGAEFGIRTSRCGTLRIIGNVFYNIHTQPEFETQTKTEALAIGGVKGDTWIVNNTFYGNDSSIRLLDPAPAYNPSQLYYAADNAHLAGTNYVCWFDNNDAGIVGISPLDPNYWKPVRVRIFGNITAGRTKQFQADVDIDSAAWANNTLDMDYNIIYNSQWGESFNFGQPTSRTLSWMRLNTRFDRHSLNLDPRFVDVTISDFSLNRRSHAIQVLPLAVDRTAYSSFNSTWGLNIQFDRAGDPRPDGPWSIGAYEYLGSDFSRPASPRGVRVQP